MELFVKSIFTIKFQNNWENPMFTAFEINCWGLLVQEKS